MFEGKKCNYVTMSGKTFSCEVVSYISKVGVTIKDDTGTIRICYRGSKSPLRKNPSYEEKHDVILFPASLSHKLMAYVYRCLVKNEDILSRELRIISYSYAHSSSPISNEMCSFSQ